jgi:MOSC domain-containing protein YiiM
MTGSILQISISHGGIPKRSIPEGFLGPLGIEGDAHARPQFHGGPRQAVLLISSEAIADLTARGYPVFPGALGENLTTRGIDRRQMRAGQRYRVGEAVVELTKVRSPCSTLDIYGPAIKKEIYDSQVKAGDPASPRWAMSGFYASIVRSGNIRQNDIIVLVDQVV